jgi:primosomal protein N' (replication factor Y)
LSLSPTPILRVALDTPLDRLFDYLAPGAGPDALGRRVRVPFGRRQMQGIVIELAERSELADAQLKPILDIDDRHPPLPAEVLELVRFAADYYQHPFGAALLAILPPALKRPVFRAPPPRAYALTEAGRARLPELPARAHAQRRLAERLAGGSLPASALADLRPVLRDWLQQGLVAPADPCAPIEPATPGPVLSPGQAAVVETVRAHAAGFKPWLLHGVTGSGKTEVYLRLIETVLAAGKQALVLVPEIHLTPQLTERFAARFPGRRLVGLHSALADGERLSAWLDCLEGRADIVLGTRLAVFAPLPRLGMIVIDEEHDASYKQMDGLRYSARDVAIWRAHRRDIPVLLGSATPALESWRNAQAGRYKLLALPERAAAEARLPAIRLVDTRTDRPRQGLSEALVQGLKARLALGEQSLVFINRRGYAPTLYCPSCGHIVDCRRCSAHMVLHRLRDGFELRCHHCGLAARPPQACPDCGSLDLRPFGQGTQKVETALAEQFPEARLLRIDRDTTARKGAFAEMRGRIAARAVDILVGTQIVAKGHDFPHLTFVAVVGADQALMSPDFRASERLFAQLMQVAGRAGRAERPGEVLVQTDYPRHPLYAALQRHDYAGFAKTTLHERREADFPPFVHQALLRAESGELALALAFLATAREIGLPHADGVSLYDPVPALMARIANRERAQLLVQAAARARLQAFLKTWVPTLRALPAKGVRWSLDVDPLDM